MASSRATDRDGRAGRTRGKGPRAGTGKKGALIPSIPIARAPGPVCLVGPAEEPVWPVRDAEDLQALEAIAGVFGGRLDECPAARPGSASGEETVIALGQGVAEAARLYAHLTRRRVRVVEDATELDPHHRPAVVIVPADRIDVALMERLYPASDDGMTTGIILAVPGDDLVRQVLVRAAAAALCGPVTVPRIDFYPQIPAGEARTPTRWILGGEASAESVREAVSQGAGVLNVLTHSDGLDAHFGPGLTLCPMDRVSQGADPLRGPRCVSTGLCHRQRRPVDEARASGVLLSPAELRVRVLVLEICSGVLLESGVFDPRWGIGHALSRAAGVGAVVTTWSIVFANFDTVDSLVGALEQGEPVGLALRRFQRASATSVSVGHRMCLLGDPRVQACPAPAAAVRRAAPDDGAPDYGDDDADDDDDADSDTGPRIPAPGASVDVTFLRGLLLAARDSTSGTDAELGDEALAALARYDEELAAGRAETGPHAAGPRMRQAVLRFLFTQGTILSKWWIVMASDMKVVDTTSPCMHCGAATDTLETTFAALGAMSRHMIVCPRCGIVADRPSEMQLSLATAESPRMRITGALPEEHWTAALHMGSPLPADNTGWFWPGADSGLPAPAFEAPDAAPVGPLRLSFVLMTGARLAVAARFWRSAPGPR